MLIGHEGWMTVSYRVIGERSKRVSNTIPRDAARLLSPRDAIKCRRISSESTDQAGLSVKRGTSSDPMHMHMHRHGLSLARSPTSLTWGYDRLLICGGRRSARLCSHIVFLLRMRVAICNAFVAALSWVSGCVDAVVEESAWTKAQLRARSLEQRLRRQCPFVWFRPQHYRARERSTHHEHAALRHHVRPVEMSLISHEGTSSVSRI